MIPLSVSEDADLCKVLLKAQASLEGMLFEDGYTHKHAKPVVLVSESME